MRSANDVLHTEFSHIQTNRENKRLSSFLPFLCYSRSLNFIGIVQVCGVHNRFDETEIAAEKTASLASPHNVFEKLFFHRISNNIHNKSARMYVYLRDELPARFPPNAISARAFKTFALRCWFFSLSHSTFSQWKICAKRESMLRTFDVLVHHTP